MDVVVFQCRLPANALKKFGLLHVIIDYGGEHSVRRLGSVVAIPLPELALKDRQDILLEKCRKLAGDRERNDLVAEPIAVDLRGLSLREIPRSKSPHEFTGYAFQPRDKLVSERDVNEGGNEDREVVGDDLEEEDLLRAGHLVVVLRPVVLKVREDGRNGLEVVVNLR